MSFLRRTRTYYDSLYYSKYAGTSAVNDLTSDNYGFTKRWQTLQFEKKYALNETYKFYKTPGYDITRSNENKSLELVLYDNMLDSVKNNLTDVITQFFSIKKSQLANSGDTQIAL